jgi:chromate transporter
VIGLVGHRLRPAAFEVIEGHQAKDGEHVEGSVADWLDANPPKHSLPSTPRALRVAITCGVLWFVPIGLLVAVLGAQHVFAQEAIFFSKAAVVTFGGAYAVLAYIGQQAVERYAWLEPGEMLDGLGMAETTPGPLIQVVQFVGFMGAYRNPGGFDPLVAGLVGSVVTTWVTYVPCFLWIFLGAPFIEALRGKRWLNAALSTITAAVVGVVLNLAVWFALHTLFADVRETIVGPLRLLVPTLATIDWLALALSAVAFLALFRFKRGMIVTLAGCALLGAVLRGLLG